MNIPWKLKSVAFSALNYMPDVTLYILQKYVTGNSKVKFSTPYVGWEYHKNSVAKMGAKRLLEFGAGKNLAQNIFLSALVEQQVVVDLFPMLDVNQVNDGIRRLKEIGAPIDGRSIADLDDLEKIYSIRYLAPLDMRKTNFNDGEFDICISTNTLEHIPREDIESIFLELFRIVKPNGCISAMIDYSDHYAHTDRSITRLNYLRFTEAEWKQHNHAKHYQNRMRHDHYAEIFKYAGFEVMEEDPTNIETRESGRLRPELLTGHKEDFATTGFWRLLRPAQFDAK